MTAKSSREGGYMVSMELAMLISLMTIVIATGLPLLHNAMTSEMADIANSIESLDQSYKFDGQRSESGSAVTSGSVFIDDGYVFVAVEPLDPAEPVITQD